MSVVLESGTMPWKLREPLSVDSFLRRLALLAAIFLLVLLIAYLVHQAA
jgi:hypothetical protein